MGQQDYTMPDVSDVPAALGQVVSIDALQPLLNEHLGSINQIITKGFQDFKFELQQEAKDTLTTKTTFQSPRNHDSSLGILVRHIVGSANPSDNETDQLNQKYRKVREDYRVLREERDQIGKRLQQLEQQSEKVENLEKQLLETKQQNRKLQEQSTRFRDIILAKHKGSEEIGDASIIATFVSLREQIQRIVFRFYAFDQLPLLPAAPTTRQQVFYKSWTQKISQSQLKNRARAVLWEILAGEILRPPCFGLGDLEPHGELEQNLVKFERLLHSGRVNGDDITEWRTRTVKCAKLLYDSGKSSTPDNVGKIIWDFLDPIRDVRPRGESKGVLQAHLKELTTSAYELKLKLRGCKDLYKFEDPDRDTILVDGDAEPQDSEKLMGQRVQEPDTVAFTLHGALVKYPEHGNNDRVVLEKSHVVVFN